ncbi:MAG: M1 family metallopeptidase, partial [Saprospiraceae bacterium]|nr:M1 family metallopeptidase [Saprospiraceae bacterium]
MKQVIVSIFTLLTVTLFAQPDRWQQRAYYQMDIDFDVKNNQFDGTQKLVYQNNSPDTLFKVFYHLYFNAFQPNSMMDVRSRTLEDPDRRVGDRILNLKQDEIGFQKVLSLHQDGDAVSYVTQGTILEVDLAHPILPHSSSVFDMTFKGQVPLQIRRSGRDNEEGIRLSMAQWYPKMSEYDYQGWHANPYIGREFYGIWGDFDVTIHIDKDYILAGTGYVMNADVVGYGYEKEGQKVTKPKGDKLTWHFFAPNVHDFVWAADPDYTHDKLERADGLTIHFFYQKNENTEDSWSRFPPIADAAFDYINQHFGPYPYKQYSFIQGGDGGMEYPMATLLTGHRSLGSLVGTGIHELMHSWYQGLMGTNEALYAWMDEGFTNWTEGETLNELKRKGIMPGTPVENPHLQTIKGYRNFMMSGKNEALSIHADHFSTSYAYWLTAYTGGETFLEQLRYIMGEEAHAKGMLDYYWTWRFKHPNSNDFIRVMEKASGLELDWFKEYFIYTTHTIDYGVKSVEASGNSTKITLEKIGKFPMPLDVLVTYENGTSEMFNIP